MTNRLLILAPHGRDADVAAALFGRNAIAHGTCPDIARLLEAIEADAGAVLLTEEVLDGPDAHRLGEWVTAQPEWSDLPFIVLARGHHAPRSARALQRLEALGNVVLLERPLHAEAMLGAVRSALKARARQVQVRDYVARLADRESELRFTLESGRLGSWTLDLATEALTTSEVCRVNFGRDPAEPLTYRQLREAVHPDDRVRMARALDESIARRADYDIEYRLITPDGQVRWVLIRARPVHAGDGTPVRMTGVSLDITERKSREANRSALADLADAIRGMRDASDLAHEASAILGRTLGVDRVGYATIDALAGTLRVEREWTAAGVASLAGVVRFDDYAAFVDGLEDDVWVAIADVRGDGRPAAPSAALGRRDVRACIDMPVVEQGRLRAVVYVHHAEPRHWTDDDLALVKEIGERTRTAVERSRADAALGESEARYRTLFENVNSGFCVVEVLFDEGRPVDFVFLEVNPAFAAHTGLANAAGRRIGELVPEHDRRWCDLFGSIAVDGRAVRVEEEARALRRWFDVHAYPVGLPAQRRVAVLFNDVTARKETERRLRELNETLEQQVAERTADRNALWQLSSDIMLRSTFDGVITAVNPAWTTVLGWTEAELLGADLFGLIHPDDLDATRRGAREFAKGVGHARLDNRYRHRDGGYRWISWSTRPADDRINAVGRDITADKEREARLAAAQEALRHAQKMEAMGTLTGGVAHDFNNLLTPIVGSLDMLQRRGLGGEREQRLILRAVQSAERAKTLVQRLLAFARRQPLQPVAVDLAPLVRGMADLVASTTGPQIAVVVETADDLPPAKADPNQLEMAILNLAVNARDAMPDGGTLRIRVDAQTVCRQDRAEVAPGRYLRLSVADTGTGMDAATIARAVEPFFSTKGVGKGTGLGLSMAHGLASQLGGALTIRSAVGEGTTIELWLPESVAHDGGVEPPPERAALPAGVGTALLVDDEDLVRLNTADMLSELGYAVVEAASAEEALGLIERGLRPDVVVTDHLMPGISGTQLARTLHDSRPDTKVLIISGYAELEGIEPDLPRLPKPFRSADLAVSLAALA